MSGAALRHVHLLAAAEEVGGLDPDQHRQLPPLDHLPCLARVVDQPEPALAAAAGLRVDVALQPPKGLDLLADSGRLVAGMGLDGLDLADRLVLDRLRDDQTLARHPVPLQPDVVGLLVGDGVVDRPAGEGRPAVRVVGPEGEARAQEVAGDVEAPVGAVHVRVVTEGLGDAVGVEGLAGEDRAAGAQIGGDMQMHVGEAEDVALAVGPAERRARSVQAGLGERRAAADPNQPEEVAGPSLADREAPTRLPCAGAAGSAATKPNRSPPRRDHPPGGRRAGRRLAGHRPSGPTPSRAPP